MNKNKYIKTYYAKHLRNMELILRKLNHFETKTKDFIII